MAQQAWSQDQLNDHIKSVVIPLIKDTIGTTVTDVVKEAVATALKAAPRQGYTDKLFGEGDRTLKREPGVAMARGLRAIAAAKLLGGGPERAIEVLRGWGNTDLADEWTAQRTKALAAGDPTAGGFLVPVQFSTDVIELLRPSAVVRSLDPAIMPMPMGTVKVPKITAGAAATYVGENAAPNAVQQQTGQITLTFKKLIALVPISNDLVRYSSPSADTIVRDDMIRALATREDKAFIRDDGTNGTPRGLKGWINSVNRFNANATVNLANVTIDLGKAIQKLMAADVPLIIQQHPPGGTAVAQAITARPGWIMSPRTYMFLTTVQNAQGFYAFRPEMMAGTLWGFPFRVTSQVLETQSGGGALLGGSDTGGTQTEVYFGAFAHAVIGEALAMMVDASTEAAYADAGGTVQAAFSLDQTVVRVLAEHDFALRHDKAFALISNVTWGL